MTIWSGRQRSIASVFYAGGIIGMVSILFCLVVAVGRLKRYSVK